MLLNKEKALVNSIAPLRDCKTSRNLRQPSFQALEVTVVGSQDSGHMDFIYKPSGTREVELEDNLFKQDNDGCYEGFYKFIFFLYLYISRIKFILHRFY